MRDRNAAIASDLSSQGSSESQLSNSQVRKGGLRPPIERRSTQRAQAALPTLSLPLDVLANCVPLFCLAPSLVAARVGTPPQNRFLNLISKLKLLLRAVNFCVDACSYCAMKNSRSETRYSSARI